MEHHWYVAEQVFTSHAHVSDAQGAKGTMTYLYADGFAAALQEASFDAMEYSKQFDCYYVGLRQLWLADDVRDGCELRSVRRYVSADELAMHVRCECDFAAFRSQ